MGCVLKSFDYVSASVGYVLNSVEQWVGPGSVESLGSGDCFHAPSHIWSSVCIYMYVPLVMRVENKTDILNITRCQENQMWVIIGLVFMIICYAYCLDIKCNNFISGDILFRSLLSVEFGMN